MAEATDAGDHHPVARLGVCDLEALVDRDSGAQHRSNLDKIDICREMADVGRIGDDVVRESAID
jgi:hypothetical protein